VTELVTAGSERAGSGGVAKANRRQTANRTPSREDLERLVEALIGNSQDLMRSGELLLEHRRYAHAYEMFHLAIEEYSKAHLTMAQWLALLSGRPPEWDLFWKVWTRHDIKVRLSLFIGGIAELSRQARMASGFDTPPNWSMPTDEQFDELMPHLEPVLSQMSSAFVATGPTARLLHEKRLDAVYVDWRNDSVVEPAQSVFPEEVQEALAFLRSGLDHLANAWRFRSVMAAIAPRMAPELSALLERIDDHPKAYAADGAAGRSG